MEVNKRVVPEDNYIFNEVIHTGKKLFVTRIGLRIRLTKDHFHWGKLKVCVWVWDGVASLMLRLDRYNASRVAASGNCDTPAESLWIRLIERPL